MCSREVEESVCGWMCVRVWLDVCVSVGVSERERERERESAKVRETERKK